jgi:hypothetical protein
MRQRRLELPTVAFMLGRDARSPSRLVGKQGAVGQALRLGALTGGGLGAGVVGAAPYRRRLGVFTTGGFVGHGEGGPARSVVDISARMPSPGGGFVGMGGGSDQLTHHVGTHDFKRAKKDDLAQDGQVVGGQWSTGEKVNQRGSGYGRGDGWMSLGDLGGVY